MLIDKQYNINVSGPNIERIRSIIPSAEVGDIVSLSSVELINLGKGRTLLDCSCNKCLHPYQQEVKRLVDVPHRQEYCGKCCVRFGNEKTKKVISSPEHRKKVSDYWKAVYQTPEGIAIRRKMAKGCEKSNTPENITIWTKNLKHFIGEEHPNYNPDKKELIEYRRLARIEERKHDLSLLENSDKPRTLAGIDGGYQLDHIISIHYGFYNGISPEKIGHISNLRFIPWEENIKKRHHVLQPNSN